MSYPSINRHLATQGATIDNATDQQMHQAFVAAFQSDLPLGFAHVETLVEKLEGQDRAMHTLDPNSEEGKQFARLLGPDIPRKILSDHFGVSFGFYNCCKGVVGRTTANLNMSYANKSKRNTRSLSIADMRKQTIVIVDGLEWLDQATRLAELSRPDDVLIYSIFGIDDCMDIPDGKGGERHVHWFDGKADTMRGGVARRKASDAFGGFLYATPKPQAPHVQAQCSELQNIGSGCTPIVLKLG